MSRDDPLPQFCSPVNLQIDYAGELNPQQHDAVTALPGPSLVLAGAGAGKTRTLIYRVAFLLEQGIPADRILLLTFTNKAAREMMRRVADLLGSDLAELWGGTFHSIALRFPKPEVLGDIFSMAVNTRKSIPEILGEQYDYFSMLAPQIETLAVKYQA